MADDYGLGYYPPGTKPKLAAGTVGEQTFGYVPSSAAKPRVRPVAAQAEKDGRDPWDIAIPGVCPFCAADFRGKKNPALSLAAHVRKMKSDGEHKPPA